jgi:hypothetical protein
MLTTADCTPAFGVCSEIQDSDQTIISGISVTDSNLDDPGTWVTTPEPSAVGLTLTVIGLLMTSENRRRWARFQKQASVHSIER